MLVRRFGAYILRVFGVFRGVAAIFRSLAAALITTSSFIVGGFKGWRKDCRIRLWKQVGGQ